jgi:hypothetical protein
MLSTESGDRPIQAGHVARPHFSPASNPCLVASLVQIDAVVKGRWRERKGLNRSPSLYCPLLPLILKARLLAPVRKEMNSTSKEGTIF